MEAGQWPASMLGPTDPTKVLWAYPENFVTDKQTHTHSIKLYNNAHITILYLASLE